MMYTINKIVGYLISPVEFGMALVAAAVLTRVLGRRRLAGWMPRCGFRFQVSGGRTLHVLYLGRRHPLKGYRDGTDEERVRLLKEAIKKV